MKQIISLIMMTLGLTFFTACSKEAEPAAPVDKTMQETEEAAEAAAVVVEDAAEKAADKVEEAAEEAADKVDEAAEEVDEAM